MAALSGKRERRAFGIIPASVTPMRADGSADHGRLATHCRRLLGEGCTAIVLLGTTGEANSFTANERRQILERLLSSGIGPERLIVGTGCSAIGDTVALSRHALSMGVARVLVLPPFYYKKVSDAGIFDAYARTIEGIADDRLRLFLYQIPQMSGVDLGVALVERLASAYPATIAGLKDSSGDWERTQALCRALGDRIDILVGTETLLVRALGAGATGCVSATANVNGAAIVELFRCTESKSVPPGLETRVTEVRAAFERFAVIPALKAYLAAESGDDTWRNVRPPLVPLGQAETASLRESVATLDASPRDAGSALPKK
jgi:4-hydroxy-tetrahydrodipicolinate synthase